MKGQLPVLQSALGGADGLNRMFTISADGRMVSHVTDMMVTRRDGKLRSRC